MDIIYGRNSVYEALRANRRSFKRLLVAQGVKESGRLQQTLALARQRNIPVERLPRPALDKISTGAQGVALEASAYPYSDLGEMLQSAAARSEPALLLILDMLQDPQNFGTLLRTAEATGVHGILLPFRGTATVTPAVVNASSGACEHLLIAQANLAQSIAVLKEEGVWVIGLEGAGIEGGPEAQPPERVRLDGPLALVVGSEGQGIRQLVGRSCDILLRLPMRGQVESLNAAVAGSVALYLAWQARGYR